MEPLERLRQVSDDIESHRVSHDEWMGMHQHTYGVILFLRHEGIYAAYFDDAQTLWGQSDDARPMFHCDVQSCGPARTLIHPDHIHAWLDHLTNIYIPVQVASIDVLDDDEG